MKEDGLAAQEFNSFNYKLEQEEKDAQRLRIRSYSNYCGIMDYCHTNHWTPTSWSKCRRQLWISSLKTPITHLALFLLILAVSGSAEGARLPEKICGNILVQCSADNLAQLENCTVIEGSLTILQIDQSGRGEYEKFSFPMLREVTGFVVVSRAFGLRTLRHLFPNLAVIRGETLFRETFALVIHDNPDLQDIGLIGLTTIMHGAVRISKNIFLCYVDTVDWPVITTGVQASENVIKDNRDIMMCANTCMEHCNKTNAFTGAPRPRCWTSEETGCQKGPGLSCQCSGRQSCGPDGICCHSYCAGGCTEGGQPTDCIACKSVMYDNSCQPKCPQSTFLFSGRRCLTDVECLGLDKQEGHDMLASLQSTNRMPQEESQQGGKETTTGTEILNMDDTAKLLRGRGGDGKCVFQCPPGYKFEEKSSGPECVECVGICPRECNGITIHLLKDSEVLQGCTKIIGNLTMHIKSGTDIDKELTKNLGNIQEITGILRITSSHALLTLYFLQSLEKIGSRNKLLQRHGEALVIMDNDNLEELFDQQQVKKMAIEGNVSFIGNRHLCQSKIARFIDSTGATPQHSLSTNGEETSDCALQNISLSVLDIGTGFIKIQIQLESDVVDPRLILHYSVHFKEVTGPVKDIYEGRDACSTNSWIIYKVNADTEDFAQTVAVPILNLKPYTKYAMFAKAQVMEDTAIFAHSPIYYVKTDIGKPSYPEDLETLHLGQNEMKLVWKPPKEPNSDVTFYTVRLSKDEYSQNINFAGRDLCSDKELEELLWYTDKRQKQLEAERRKKEASKYDRGCCECPKTEQEIKTVEHIRMLEIDFENAVQSQVFQKRWNEGCLKANKVALEMARATNLKYRRKREAIQMLFHDGTNFSRPIRKEDLPKTKFPQYNGLLDSNNFSLSGNDSLEDASNRSNEQFRNFSLSGNTSVAETSNQAVYSNFPTSVNANSADTLNKSIEEPQTDKEVVTLIVSEHPYARLTSLDHFSWYTIEVQACHGRGFGNYETCGRKGVTKVLTLPDSYYDAINETTVHISKVESNRTGDRLITWEEPARPNGAVLKYMLYFQRLDEKAARTICISEDAFKNSSGSYRLEKLKPGNYSLRIRVFTEGGRGPMSRKFFFHVEAPVVEDRGLGTAYIIVIVIAVIIICVIILVAAALYYKFSRESKLETVTRNPHYFFSEDFYVPDEWEVGRDNISFIKEVGQGSFGKVYEGIMRDTSKNSRTPVAIKTVNDKADFFEKLKFLKEASTMKYFECHHVVKLLGVVSQGQPALMIMELMALGDLRNYLRKCRDDEEDYPDFHPPTAKQIRQMAGEIADGMAYLSHMKIIHRDLAARNCLVGGDGTVKIGDFGMARELDVSNYYRKDQKALLPVRWMAPESLNEGIFTTMSDVWSYGVVMYEMVTLAEQPYIGQSNDEVFAFVIGGGTMRAPVGCHQDLYDIMQQCWAYNPKHRPTFKFLIEMLLPYMNDKFKEVSFFLQEVACSDAGDDIGEDDDDNSIMIDLSGDNHSQYEAPGGDSFNWDADEMWRKRWNADHPHHNDGLEQADNDSDGITFPSHRPRTDEEYLNLHYASGSDGEDFSSAKGLYVSCSPNSKARPNPYLSSCPAQISPSPSSPVSRSPVAHGAWHPSPPHMTGSSHIEEKSPLLSPVGLSTSPPSVSVQLAGQPPRQPLAAMEYLDDIDRDEGEISGGDSEFEDTVDFAVPMVKVKDKKYRPLSGDAREPSERLRLLSDSSQAESWKSAEDSAHRSDRDSGTSQQFSSLYPEDSMGPHNHQASPSFVSPPVLPLPLRSAASQRSSTPSTVKSSSSSSSSSLPLSSQTVGHSEPSPYISAASEAVAELPPALIAPSQTQATPPSAIQPPFSIASLRPFVSPQESKTHEDLAQTAGNEADGRKESVNSLNGSKRRRDSNHSNSNTGSINSGSLDGSNGGSKDSSSSAGSHHRFTANGHGPFSRQAAALC